jgi:hypothetical protein
MSINPPAIFRRPDWEDQRDTGDAATRRPADFAPEAAGGAGSKPCQLRRAVLIQVALSAIIFS